MSSGRVHCGRLSFADGGPARAAATLRCIIFGRRELSRAFVTFAHRLPAFAKTPWGFSQMRANTARALPIIAVLSMPHYCCNTQCGVQRHAAAARAGRTSPARPPAAQANQMLRKQLVGGEPEGDFFGGSFGGVRPVDQIAHHIAGIVAANGAGGGIERLGCADHLAT